VSREAAGFVLAGGSSLRMGRDKATLPWGEAGLLDHALARLRGACAVVWILSGSRQRYTDRGVPVLTDPLPDAGPLAGVLAGLQALEGDQPGLFLAVDLPFVPEPLLRGLLERAPGYDAVVPVTLDGPHPLCAVYRRSCAEPIRQGLERGQRRATAFWAEVRVREVPEPELAAFGDPRGLLCNLNTPEDYAAAVAVRGR
jgi:molybdopterin-guanine dinucleotide biosynthesis protein A